jgi:hypothetical protein
VPVICGSATHSTTAAASAASTALPPARNTSIAASVASGCEVAAMASPEIAGERRGCWKSRISVLKKARIHATGGRVEARAIMRLVARLRFP